jgi:hypothetical protein
VSTSRLVNSQPQRLSESGTRRSARVSRVEREVGALSAQPYLSPLRVIFLRALRRQRANRLERDFLGTQFFDQISGLLERHVAIVVAMNEEKGERQFAMKLQGQSECYWPLLMSLL